VRQLQHQQQEPADIFHTPRADLIAVTAPPSPVPAAAAAVEHTDARSGGGGEWKQRQLPSSWLLFQQAFWFPQFVGFTLVPNILLPVQVARLVGPGGEGSALGLVNMLIQLSGFTQPFIGAWSDRTARRPFILWGQVGVRAANSGGPRGPLAGPYRNPWHLVEDPLLGPSPYRKICHRKCARTSARTFGWAVRPAAAH
jgi:hypothetical protein